jgi:hypothetical protein
MSNTESTAGLPPITDEDRQFLSYNPNTEDIVEWVQAYARRSIEAARSSAGPDAMRAFHDYFRDRCEMLFERFGMEAIDLYNAAALTTREARPAAPAPTEPVSFWRTLLALPVVGWIRRQDALEYAPVMALYRDEPQPENGTPPERVFSVDQIAHALAATPPQAAVPAEPVAWFLNDAAEGAPPHYVQINAEYIGTPGTFPLFGAAAAPLEQPYDYPWRHRIAVVGLSVAQCQERLPVGTLLYLAAPTGCTHEGAVPAAGAKQAESLRPEEQKGYYDPSEARTPSRCQQPGAEGSDVKDLNSGHPTTPKE